MHNVTKGWRVAMAEIGAVPRHLGSCLAARRVVQETSCGSLCFFRSVTVEQILRRLPPPVARSLQ